jgi:hypothetical protein
MEKRSNAARLIFRACFVRCMRGFAHRGLRFGLRLKPFAAIDLAQAAALVTRLELALRDDDAQAVTIGT